MVFFLLLINVFDIIICVYRFELFSQVSDVTHGPFVLLWHWLTISGTRMYLHEATRCIPSWFGMTLTYDLKVKFIGFLTLLFVRTITFFALTLAYHIRHIGVSPWGNSLYILIYVHDLDMTLIFDLKVKFIGFLTWHCVQAIYVNFFILWHSHTIYGTWVYHHGTMCHIGRDLCTTSVVWPRPLWVARGILCGFYSQFLSFLYCFHNLCIVFEIYNYLLINFH